MITQTEIERWLNENTFYCEALKARISKRQCEAIQRRPTITELALGEYDPTEFNSDFMQCKPFACLKCERANKNIIKKRRVKRGFARKLIFEE